MFDVRGAELSVNAEWARMLERRVTYMDSE